MSRALTTVTLIAVLSYGRLEAQMVPSNGTSAGASESPRPSSPPRMVCPESEALVPWDAKERGKLKLKEEGDKFKDRRKVSIPEKHPKSGELHFTFEAGIIARPAREPLVDGRVFFQFYSYQNRTRLAEAVSPMRLLFADDRDLNFLVDDSVRVSLGSTEYSPSEDWAMGSHNVSEFMTIYPSFQVLVSLARGEKVEGKLGSKEFALTPEQITAMRDLVRFAVCSGQ
jgi:hypothetical protein